MKPKDFEAVRGHFDILRDDETGVLIDDAGRLVFYDSEGEPLSPDAELPPVVFIVGGLRLGGRVYVGATPLDCGEVSDTARAVGKIAVELLILRERLSCEHACAYALSVIPAGRRELLEANAGRN